MSGLKFAQLGMTTISIMLLLAGCVSEQKYDALQQRYNQLNQTMSSEVNADQMHIERLQNAIKVTVNGELLFPSGGWQMPATAQQTIGKMVPILAPMQQTKIMVNCYTDITPIGPELRREGRHRQPDFVTEAGRQRDELHDLAGRQPQLGVSAGVRRCRPSGLERYGGRQGAEPTRGTDAGGFGQLNHATIARSPRSGRRSVA